MVRGGAHEVAEALRGGADINAQDHNGNTALFLAASLGDLKALTALLNSGAALEVQNKWGNTALWAATFNARGNGALIEALLAAGADPDHKNAAGNSPRMLASRVANYNLEQFFTEA